MSKKTRRTSASISRVNETIRPILRTRWSIISVCTAFVAFLVNAAVFYPGFMSYDSLWQLSQAKAILPISDWHPPIMALVWKVLLSATGIVGSMLLFQLAILWGSIAIISIVTFNKTQSLKWAALWFMLPLLPYIGNISGVIWKDVHMAYAFLLATAMAFVLHDLRRRRVRARWLAPATVTVALTAIGYAVLLRYNALIAAIPIIYIIMKGVGMHGKMLAVSLIGFMVGIVALAQLLPIVSQAVKTNPSTAIMTDDIIHLSDLETLRSLRVPTELKASLLTLKKCESKEIFVNLYWRCTSSAWKDIDRDRISRLYPERVKDTWLRTISADPFGYASYRIRLFAWFIFPQNSYIWHDGIDTNRYELSPKYPELSESVKYYTFTFHRSFPFIFEGWFWILVSGVLLYVSRCIKDGTYKRIIRALALSSVLYIVCYFPTTVAIDYRYIYWPALACTISVFIYLSQRTIREKSHRS